ncbi:MAG: methionyl-tRNA formyltransferase [Elusimicrobiota bacterium]|nr:methionyl-tRNA formyltransferase [Elusimicrobiota bacterium]
MRILFFGTSGISRVFLESLYIDNHILFSLTRLDKGSFRGQKLNPPAVKIFSIEKNIPFLQVDSFTGEIFEEVKSFKPDLGISVSFGKIIPEYIFNLPRLKTINIHFSLLPKYRGASPVQYSIINGEKETGVCSFFIEKNLDSGDIITLRKSAIDFKDTSETLFQKLTPLGIETMRETIELLQDKNFKPKKQTGEIIYAPLLKKEDGHINWNGESLNIYNRIRGLYPWPGAFSIILNKNAIQKRLKIIESEIADYAPQNEKNGAVFEVKKGKGFFVKCGKGALLIKTVQPENKPKMSAWDFIMGRQIFVGGILS